MVLCNMSLFAYNFGSEVLIASMTNKPASAFPAEVANLLQSRLPRKLDIEHTGRAAVLMPIFERNHEYVFLLTQRTQQVETHKGQISFPGGVRESEDEPLVETALRETWEEIGLSTDRVQVIGEFDEYPSVTGLIVTPFAGWIEAPFELSPNPDEVEEVLYVPLSLFRDETRLRIERRMRQKEAVDIYFYEFEGREIWGLTARIIRYFIRLIDGKAFTHP